MADLLTLADLQSAVGAQQVNRLSDDDRDNTPDPVVIADILTRVRARIAGAITRLYPNTNAILDNPPDTLRDIARDIGVQYLFKRKVEFLAPGGITPWEGQYKTAIALLEQIRKGQFRLDIDEVPGGPPANAGGTVVTTTVTGEPYPQTFTRGFGSF